VDPGADEKPGASDGPGDGSQANRRKNDDVKERGGGKNAQASRQEGTRSPDLPEEQYDANLQGTRHRDKTLQHMLQEIQDARTL